MLTWNKIKVVIKSYIFVLNIVHLIVSDQGDIIIIVIMIFHTNVHTKKKHFPKHQLYCAC